MGDLVKRVNKKDEICDKHSSVSKSSNDTNEETVTRTRTKLVIFQENPRSRTGSIVEDEQTKK